MKILLYIMVASSLISADLISINIKIMELSLFRVSILLITFLTFLNYLKTNHKMNLKVKYTKDSILRFYLFWLLYSLLTLGWVQDYNGWFKAVFYIGLGFLSILAVSIYVKNEGNLLKVFYIIFGMIVLHNIIGWSELLTGVYRFADMAKLDKYNQFSYNASARVPISMFGNQNDYATMLVMGIFISYIIFANSNIKYIKIISTITMVSSFILILKTDSRANILGLFIGVLCIIFIKYIRKISKKTLVLISSIPIIIFNPIFLKRIIGPISQRLYFTLSSEGSDRIRLNLIKNGLLFLKDTVGFGVGAGNIEYWMDNYRMYNVGNITNMHNWWMEILVGYGIVVFIFYIFIYYKKARFLYSSYFNSDDKFVKNISLGLLALMASFMISSISSSSNVDTAWLWLLWGIITAFIEFVEKNNKTKDDYNVS